MAKKAPTRLMVVRHAAAQDRDKFARTGKSDDLRPLTSAGRAQMRRVARGLLALERSVALIASSPLVRAVQTATLLEDSYPRAHRLETDVLRPDTELKAFLTWWRESAPGGLTAIVGHEPHLGRLVSWLLADVKDGFLELDKGGAVLLTFEKKVGPGRARLEWMMSARVLAR